MTNEEKAKIVAFARLLGVNGTPEEIIQRYQSAYVEAKAFFDNQLVKPAKAEVMKRFW